MAKEISYIEDPLERNNYIDAIARAYVINRDALAEKVHDYGVAGTPKPDVVERGSAGLRNRRRTLIREPAAGQHHMEDRAEMSGKIKQLDCCLHGLSMSHRFLKSLTVL